MGPSEHEPDDPAPTGELAHSGSDAAVTWAVGSAGALLVVGTTLAIAHRHRRAR